MRAAVVIVLAGCASASEQGSSLSSPGSGRTASGSSSPFSPSSPASAQAFVDAHNRARSRIGVPKLTWSTDLAQRAQRAAATCSGQHSKTELGENIYGKTEGPRPEEAVDAWVREAADYDYGRNACRSGRMCGHYTQVVWRSTQRVGCATQACGRWTYVYCAYDPPGNWRGEKPY